MPRAAEDEQEDWMESGRDAAASDAEDRAELVASVECDADGSARTRIYDLRAECFADDVEVTPEMVTWSDAELRAFFESGGADRPS